MYRATKRILSHSQSSLKNSIGLTRKAFYWEKKEMVTTLTPTHLEKGISLENINKTCVESPFSTASFFTGIKESEAEVTSLSSVTPAQ